MCHLSAVDANNKITGFFFQGKGVMVTYWLKGKNGPYRKKVQRVQQQQDDDN